MYGMRYAGEGHVYVAAWGRRVDMRRITRRAAEV
jgi:hypothetical protein